MTCYRFFAAVFLALAISFSSAPAAQANDLLPPRVDQLLDLIAGKGGRLAGGQTDVVINEFGICRWLDNGSADNEYFVPFATQTEWQAFIDHAPAGVTRTRCCLPQSVSLLGGDGSSVSFDMPIGRENTADERGTRTVSHVFSYVRAGDGASVTQTVTDSFVCNGESWQSQGASSSEVVVLPEEPEEVDPGAPVGCGVPVVATWNGQWRRSWGGNGPSTGVGISNVTGTYMDGNSSRTVAIFRLVTPARDTNVRITARYANYGGFSNGSEKVAEFFIADGETVVGGAGNIFYTAGRKGDQFRMTNTDVYMPSYDSSPNLLSLRIEYENPCPVEPTVFATSCRNHMTGGSACISTGGGCFPGTSPNPGAGLPMSRAQHSGSFCSAVAVADSSQDGARVDFDLTSSLAGRTGPVVIMAPLNMYVGVRSQAQADDVLYADNPMAVPDGTVRIDTHGCSGGCGDASQIAPVGAMRLYIPDINQNASTTWKRRFGIFNNKSENMVVCNEGSMTYTAATKRLVVTHGKGCRWKKGQIHVYGTGAWNQQTLYGYLNGKVWSEVRVVDLESMPAPQCGPQPSTCAPGNPGNYAEAQVGGFLTGKRRATWTCSTTSQVSCAFEWKITDYPQGW